MAVDPAAAEGGSDHPDDGLEEDVDAMNISLGEIDLEGKKEILLIFPFIYFIH
jgi:hypothetical protein